MIRFLEKYFDKKQFFTGLLLIIIAGLFGLFWSNIDIIKTFFKETFFNWLINIITIQIRIPVIALALFIIVYLIFNKWINNLLAKVRFMKGNTQKKEIKLWSVNTNMTTPQWTDIKEIDLDGGILKSVSAKVLLKTNYMRFGYKLMDDKSAIFKKGLLTNDTNYFVHIGKQANSKKIHATIYENGVRPVGDIYVCDFDESEILVELEIDNRNNCDFLINKNTIYKKQINPKVRNRLCLLVWGDNHEYTMDIKDIKVRLIN